MALEPITRQEQIIAGKDLEPITRMERFLKDYGVSNYFGETTVKGDTLTWDGNTEGLVSVEGEYDTFYRISDAIVTIDDVKNGVILTDGAESYTFPFEEINAVYNEFGVLFVADTIIFAPSDNFTGIGMTFPKAGVYLLAVPVGVNSISITIPGYNGFETTTIKKIDEKYLPEVGGALIVTITQDGDTHSTDKTFAEISAAVEGGVMVQCVCKEPWAWIFYSFSHYVPGAAVAFTNTQGLPGALTGDPDMILHSTVTIGSDNAVLLQSISASA